MDYGQEVILGNVWESSLAEIWNGEAYRRARAKVRGEVPTERDFLCARCEWHVSRSVYEEHSRRKATAAADGHTFSGSREQQVGQHAQVQATYHAS